jgi:hypothetical protein
VQIFPFSKNNFDEPSPYSIGILRFGLVTEKQELLNTSAKHQFEVEDQFFTTTGLQLE